MANLYRVTDNAMNEFYVLADDDVSASVAYKDWVEDPANEMDDTTRLPVQDVQLVASEDAAQSPAPWVNLVFGPMS